ncbi:MAG: TVP38/TMEM64 family protein [Thermodesulfobacteriota bacterium]
MNKTYKFIVLIVFVLALFFAFRYFDLKAYLDEENLQNWIAGFGLLAPLVYILIYSIAPALMLPGLLITVVGGVLFGPLWGVVYVIIGATIGAGVAFQVARLMGRDFIEARVIKAKSARWAELDAQVEQNGWKIVAFTRLIPLFPFNFLNYAFGLTRVRFSTYLWASFVFMLPGAAAYVIFSSSFLNLLKGQISKEFVIGIPLVVIVSLIPIVYKKLKSKNGRTPQSHGGAGGAGDAGGAEDIGGGNP